MRRAMGIIALTLFLAPALAVAAGVEQPLTLNEAIRLAVRKNEDIRIERESVASATAAVRGARGAYDPQLTLDGAWLRSTEPVNSSFAGASLDQIGPEVRSTQAGVAIRQLLPTGGDVSVRASGARATSEGTFALLSPAYDTRVGVELRQPLLRHLATDASRLSVRTAKADQRGASASLRRTLSETVAAVERAYWTLMAARQDVAVRDEAVRLASDQLGETRTRAESGSVPRTELAQPQAELERRRGELLAARESVARAENALKRLILAEGDEALWLAPIVPTDSAAVEVAPVDVAAALAHALSTRPELDAVAALVARRRAEAAYARDGVWPALDAVASYDRFGLAGSRNAAAPGGALPSAIDGDLNQSFETLGDGDFDAVRVGVSLGLPITNRAARASAAIARSAERQADAEVARVRKAIRAEVLDAAAALETAGQRIEAARSSREAAEVQLTAERDRYASGLSTNFLVLTRQNDLSRARLDEISALTDYRTARTEMARATGRLIEERGVETGEPPR